MPTCQGPLIDEQVNTFITITQECVLPHEEKRLPRRNRYFSLMKFTQQIFRKKEQMDKIKMFA
jgi:hypothetical protein